VRKNPGAGHAKRAGLDGFLRQPPQLGQVMFRGRLQINAPDTHDEHAQRSMRQLRREIDIGMALLDGIEIFRKALSVPGQFSAITAPGISSIPSISATAISCWSWRIGAKPTPQLPITGMVTP